MSGPEVHESITLKQFHKFQSIFPEHLIEHLFIKIILVEDTDLAFKILYIFNDTGGRRLMDRKLILLHACLFHGLHKCLHCKGIVLGRYTEFLFCFFVNVFRFQKSELLRHLPGVSQKFLTFRCDHNSPVGT